MDSLNYTADNIAGWFIDFNSRYVETEEAEFLSPMKLQKLLYYAQGAFLAIDNTALFDDDIEIWEHGPVVPSVYQKYRKYGAGGIAKNESDTSAEINEHTYGMLFGIYEKYGKYSASQLRNMTHREDPYVLARENNNSNSKVISKDCIKDYFAGTVYKKWLDDTLFDDIPVEVVN